MFAFLLLSEITARLNGSFGLPMLLLRVFVPLALIVYFYRRGEYGELHFRFSRMLLVDALLGIVLAATWIAPFVIFPSMRPTGEGIAFDPALAGVSAIPLVCSLRMIGYAFVTPVMEELFMRSFLIRFVDVFDTGDDFRSIKIGTFSWQSFLVVVAVFLATHTLWEAPVMLPWAVITTLWFYYRKDLLAVILVHAATNAAILLSAIFLSNTFNSGSGEPLSLWFFV
ncbi:CAAX prenyl protease-related protein [Novipirellula herctigrandis]